MRILTTALTLLLASATITAADAAPRKGHADTATKLLQRSYSVPCIFGDAVTIQNGVEVRDPIVADTIATVARMVAPQGGIAIGEPGSLVVTAPESVLVRVDSALAAFNENACRQVAIKFQVFDGKGGDAAAIAEALGVRVKDLAAPFVVRGNLPIDRVKTAGTVRLATSSSMVTLNGRIVPMQITKQVGEKTTGFTADFVTRLTDHDKVDLQIYLTRSMDDRIYSTSHHTAIKDGDTLVWTVVDNGLLSLYAVAVSEMQAH